MKKMVAGLVMLGFGVALALPPEGLYFGSASYGGKGNPTQLAPCYTGHAHSRWTGARPTPSEQIRITKEEGYGNCLQFWQWNGDLANLVERLGAKTVAHLDAKRVLVEADEASVRRLSADARVDSLSERLPSAKVDATLAKRIADGAKTVETTVVALSEADREGLMARVAAAGGELLAGCCSLPDFAEASLRSLLSATRTYHLCAADTLWLHYYIPAAASCWDSLPWL